MRAMSTRTRDWIHSAFIATGMGVAVIGGIIFRAFDDIAPKLFGTLLTVVGGLAIFFAYRINPLENQAARVVVKADNEDSPSRTRRP
jgi:hypothetical protein